MDMNLSLALPNILLMLVGLGILLLTAAIFAVRIWRSPITIVRAGLLSVLLVLIACILIAFGLGSLSFSIPAAQMPRIPVGLALLAGLLVAVLGYVLFRKERQHDNFNPSVSPGLLFLGAGVFVLVAALVIPALPRQFTAARAQALAPTSTDKPLPTRVEEETSTATVTLIPSLTPSELPTLTPTSDKSPTALATTIAYEHSQIENPTGCTVVAQTMLNLRGDPSDRQKAMGRVFAGSLLQVIGKTADKQWVRVIYNDGQNSIQGWVNAQFIMVGATCADSSIPLIVPSFTPSRTPLPSRTPYPSRTPRPSVTPKG
jgi:hypothetical protein